MLIETAPDLKRWTRINYNFTIEQATPWIEQAERDFLRPTIGPEMYDLLVDHYENSGSGAVLDEALRLSQRAVGLITAHYLADVFNVQIDETGMYVFANDTHKTPYEWQKGNWEQRYLGAGVNAMEDLLDYLQEHQADFPEWTASDAFTEFHACLLRTAREFNAELAINYSAITFKDLKPALKRAQEFHLKPVLGEDFLQELIDHQENEDSGSASTVLTVRDMAILKVRPALAHLAIAEAKEVIFRRVNGALLSTRYFGAESKVVQGDETEASNLRRNAFDTGMRLLALAHAWLDEHAEELPTYAAGEGYRPAGKEEIPTTDRLHNSGGATMM